MFTQQLRHVPLGPFGKVMGIGMGIWLLVTPAAAQQVLSGMNSTTENSTRFTAPGGGNQFTADFPGAGLGEQAAQILMRAGTLSKLKVRVTTATVPSSGTFSVMVRVNGIDTALTCSVAATGQCSTGTKTKALANNSLLAIRASNNFVDAGALAYTYTLLLQ